MGFDDKDQELFLGKYSSTSFKDFYNEYEELMSFVKDLPSELKRNKNLTGKNVDYLELSRIFTNRKKPLSSKTLFKKNNNAKDIIINFWLHNVNAKVNIMESLPSLEDFKGLSLVDIKEIINLSTNPKSYLTIPSLLLKKGIILIYEKSIQGLNVDGVVYKNEKGNPIVSLSVRHNRIDNFWFTLAHELSHIFLHYDFLDNVIIDDFDEKESSQIELEANKLAGDLLIPKNIWRGCPVKYSTNSSDIISFSKQYNINPAILAGRIRNERGNFSIFNDIIYLEDVRGNIFNG